MKAKNAEFLSKEVFITGEPEWAWSKEMLLLGLREEEFLTTGGR